MPLQQISVSPLDWTKERASANQQQKNFKLQDPVFMTSGLNPLERCPSQTSTLSNNNDICRICHCEAEEDAPLIAPCYCAGSLRYVHQACLQQWIKSSDIRSCELCKFQFVMQSKLKPFREWESLEMNGVERRKLLCSVTFHAVALTCVIWSLYVLVDRTVEEIYRGQLDWPFWTKLAVVAVGLAGGAVFGYVQCRAYGRLCRRWRAFNRVVRVQNAPKLARRDSGSETCCGVVVVTSCEGDPAPDATVACADVVRDIKACTESPTVAKLKGPHEGSNAEPEDVDGMLVTDDGERSRLLGGVPSLESDKGRIVEGLDSDQGRIVKGLDTGQERITKALESDGGRIVEGDRSRAVNTGGFHPLTTTQASLSEDDKMSESPSHLSSDPSEDSLESQSSRLLQTRNLGSNPRPWASLESCPTWVEKPMESTREKNGRQESSRGSRSPLLAAVGPSGEKK